jgi:class 3 adenylate cyclase
MSLEEEDDITFLPIDRSAREVKDTPLVETSIADDRPTVLAADDNADMRAYLQRVLAKPYRVMLANDGADALEQIRLHRPELVLTDAMMPRMSGYDLLKAIRADPTLLSIPVVFLTARAGTEARVESLEAGADDYLAKPFDEHELLARVGNLIRARAQERELAQLQKEKLSRFLPSYLADMILAGDREEFLKGHRANITVVFIDLRGFTEFAESAAPEDLMVVLREYQSHMGTIISEYEATLERFSGDALMVFLNDPLPVPNHIEQGVRMAIAMRSRVVGLCREWNNRGISLGAGIGIATGYATLGVVGFEGRKDYAAIGPVINLAARLCSEATHGQILVSERVWQSISKEFRGEHIGNLTLKGFHKPMATYNLISSFGSSI